MADIELVVKIEEERYNQIKRCADNYLVSGLELAVKNGIPLPKGHGRLIDADELEKDMVNGIKSGLYEEGYETFAHINNMDDCVECVKYASTIIKADKEKNDDR